VKNLNHSSDEDKILLSRTLDAIRFCEAKNEPRFLGFFDQRQRRVVDNFVQKQSNVPHMFWGGYDESERTLIGFFPSFMEPDPLKFTIRRLDFLFRTEDKLCHRDFLGTLLSLGIKREAVGDILVADGKGSFFLSNDIADYVSSSLTKVGGVGVNKVREQNWHLPFTHNYLLLSDTIASPRLDCVVSALLNKSRAQSAFFVSIGKINVNFLTIYDTDFEIKQDDIISIRGFGRFKIEAIGPFTKKGRLSFKAKKFL
jgi:RNA-binding protein YlmH